MTPTLRAQEPMLRVEAIGLTLGLALASILMWPLRSHLTDDTFIHLQFARHLAQGRGPVFNPGEHVYGCTSPLWSAIIADAMALGWNGLIVARIIGCLATLASIGLFLQLLRRTLRLPAMRAFATVAWSCNAAMMQWSTSGLETPLAVALTLAGFVAYTEGKQWGMRPVRTGALWSLAALTRPEAVYLLVLWGILLLADTNNRSQLRRLVFGMLPPIAIYGGWLLFARFFFGTFWPRALAAHVVSAVGTGALLAQLEVVAQTDGVFVLLLVIALALGGPAIWGKREQLAQRALPSLWIVTLPLLYVARGIPANSRYLVMLLPIVAWLAWSAADRWWLGTENASRSRRTQAMVFGFAIMALVVAINLGVYRQIVLPESIGSTAALRQSLVAWGDWFGENAPPNATIASSEVGAVGFFSQRRVLDLTGVLSPEIERYTRGIPGAVERFAFAPAARPAFLVDRSPRAFDLVERSPYGNALTPLGHAAAFVRAGRIDSVYSYYRIDWDAYDTMRELSTPAR